MKVFQISFLLQFSGSHFQQCIHLLLQLAPLELQDPSCPSMCPWQVSVLHTELWTHHKAMVSVQQNILGFGFNFSYATKVLFSLASCRMGAVLGYLPFPSLPWLSVPRCYYTKTIQQCSFPFMY